MEVEIGIGKSGRRAYGFDDIAIVPSRRTRDPEDVDISWEIDAFKFELPMMAPRWTASSRPRPRSRSVDLGGLGVPQPRRALDALRGPRRVFEEIADARRPRRRRAACRRSTPSRSRTSSSAQRIREIKDAGVTACASLTPQRVEQYAKHVLEAELDILVIQGTVVSAEHVSKDRVASRST